MKNQKLNPVSKKDYFDLNIEEILESWTISDGIREVIANAIDEQLLTDTQEIKIDQKNENTWIIRDFGRGLHYQHLTMNENMEKITHPNTIGKFGIGLKDALATFYRKDVKCTIMSKYQDFTVNMDSKHGFEDIKTLHAVLSPPSEPKMVGTKVILKKIDEADIRKAKELFLRFSREKELATISYGQILEKPGEISNIYINGVKVAEEENFLFSYNITSLTKKIKDALNRERTNVGRNAYRDRIKKILLNCNTLSVIDRLIADLQTIGNYHDEMNWIDIQEHAVKIQNQQQDVVFFTPSESEQHPMLVDEATSSKKKIVYIPERLKEKIRETSDYQGNKIRDIHQFKIDYQESFEYDFILPEDLTPKEQQVYNTHRQIFKYIEVSPSQIADIKISETMKKDFSSFHPAEGCYEPEKNRIIIKRAQLQNLTSFVGTLIHEISHATSKRDDVDRVFESELTKYLGILGKKLLKNNS